MKKLLFVLPLFLGVLIFACSEDDTPTQPVNTETTIWVEDGSYWQTFVNASSYDEFKYFSFATRETVSVADPQNDTNWDIGFERYHIILNGGLSGSKGVAGIDLATVGSPDSINFAAVTDTSGITDDDWMEDSYSLAVDEWYSYNPNNHTVNPTWYVYVLTDAAGKYVKFQVTDLFDGGQPPDMGSVTFRYVYQPNGPDLSGDPDTLTLNVGTGTAYVDFSTGMEVTPADPENSLDWDIAFTEYEIHLNSSLWGPGAATAYPAYDDTSLTHGNPANFDGLLYALTGDNAAYGYFQDEPASALTNWWDHYFDSEHNQTILPSKDHVYLIKVGDAIYKMQIYSYYHPNSPLAGGWYTFFWSQLY